MSDSELSRPGAGNAPDDGEETVGLVERLSSERRTIDKILVDLEKKIGDQNIKIKTLEGKISGKRRELEIQIEKLKAEAEELAAQLAEVKLTIGAKTSSTGKIFGSVNSIMISESLKEKGFDIDRKKIVLKDVKEIGTYTALIKLHREVKIDVEFEVVSE